MYVEKCTRPFQELVALSGKNDYFDQLVFYVNVFLKVTARLHMSYVQVQTRVIWGCEQAWKEVEVKEEGGRGRGDQEQFCWDALSALQ